MLSRVFLIAVVFGLQALEAVIFIKGLRIQGKFAWLIIAAFVFFNLPVFYILWLQSHAQQPPHLLANWVVKPAYAWQFNWLCFLVFLAPIVLLVRAGVWWFHGPETVISAMRIAVFVIVVLWSFVSIYGIYSTSRPPVVEEVELIMPDLPAKEDGLRVVQLTDMHVGWWNSEKEFCRAADMAAELAPDLLLITGDMVDHNPDYVYRFADCLEGLKPRLGRYAIIGNHDVYTGRTPVANRMKERGFVMLRKEWVSLADKGSSLVLAGLDDSGMNWTSDDPSTKDIPRATAGVPPDRPCVLLKHRPLKFSDIKGLPVDLVVAGHTHGGQLKLPFGGPGLAHLTYRYAEGFHQKDGQSIYVSRGLGTVGWPFRVFCPPEITLLILRSPQKTRAGQQG